MMKIAPAVAVIVLTALATVLAHSVAASSELLQLALDMIPFAGAFAAAALVALHGKREGVPAARLLLAGYAHFSGVLIGALGAAHFVAVLLVFLARGPQPQAYSFRLYSLLLLGLLLLAVGVLTAVKATRLPNGDRAAWLASLSLWIVILAINLPLAPLQGFAVLFSWLAAFGLLLSVAMRSQFVAATR